MKKIYIFLSLLSPVILPAQVYLSTGGYCSFHSSTPVENIDAVSESMNSVFNATTGDIQFKVALTSFKFEKALMKEHFNEKYVESDKFPYATFKGKVNEKINLSIDSIYQVSAEGVFNIHGVEKIYKEKGKLTIKNRTVSLESDFKVALKDHRIEVPKIVVGNISEIIDVKIRCNYSPYQKK